jgi:hypothetical protein
MASLRPVALSPFSVSLLIVGLLLCPLLVGIEPVGGDPDLMYRPIKSELARHLRQGKLPYWSDRFGLGVPLVAESHVAAFYPPNRILYRLLDAPRAFRLSQWLHYVALAASTYVYALELGITPWGCTTAAIGFSLCGFQAIHAAHEPFYTLMPYMPLCLLLGDRFMMTGQLRWLALMALAWGAQLTIGHFQIQMWTAGLVMVIAAWRVLRCGLPAARYLALAGSLGWGVAIAWVQLGLTWELTRITGFFRPPDLLINYNFPLTHWAQWALPGLYLEHGHQSDGIIYWGGHGTTSGEACAYVGITALILSCVGIFALRRDSVLAPWRWIAPLAFVLATMPRWWPEGYRLFLMLPGVGWFRAPARYTLLTSLGLTLLAGRGLDRSISTRRFLGGLSLALAIGVGSWVWSIALARDPLFQNALGSDTFFLRFGSAAFFWCLSLSAVITWRWGSVGTWAPLTILTIELGGLFYLSPIPWGWSASLPQASPMLKRLAQEPGVGLVAGRLQNLPILAGQATAYPLLGITPPPPNYLLESALTAPGNLTERNYRWQRRFGVTHGVWSESDDTSGTELLTKLIDVALKRGLVGTGPMGGETAWKLVRYPEPFPAAWIALRAFEVGSWQVLFATLSAEDRGGEAWFLHGEGPPETRSQHSLTDFLSKKLSAIGLDIELGNPAKTAQIKAWGEHTFVVEHDGTCYIILRRTHYPGWFYQINGGPEQPVLKVNGGLQCVPLTKAGTSHVEMSYRPPGLRHCTAISLCSTAAAFIVLIVGLVRGLLRVKPAIGKRPSKPR